MQTIQWTAPLFSFCFVFLHFNPFCNGLAIQTKPNLPRSYIEFVEPESQCKVILLACLHGSSSSASDVTMIMQDQHTDVVVLELCASRLADLRRSDSNSTLNSQPTAVQRFITMLAKTKEKKGLPTAIAAFVLGGASGLQTALSGNKPGLEFTTALDFAMNSPGCDLVLADQSVEETLRRIGSLPSISLSMMKDFLKTLDWSKSYGHDCSTLKTAIFGDTSMNDHDDNSNNNNQLQLGNFMLRNQEVIQELVQLTLPPLFLAGVTAKVIVSLLGNILNPLDFQSINAFAYVPDIDLSTEEMSRIILNELSELVSSVAVISIGFILLALPAARVILRERDEFLERGIRTACQLAASKSPQGRVVAILGFLHVNGVAKRLLQNDGNKME